MPDDLADELQSMSFCSSERSGSSTTLSTASASSSSAAAAPATDLHRLRSEKIFSMSDIHLVHRLGSGDIGSVYLAELKPNTVNGGCGGGGGESCMVAAKVMDKKELEGRNKAGRACTERDILELLDHPFLPKLYGIAENDRWSCILTEFCPGGDLHVLRQKQNGRRFAENAVRFYAAEVVVAMEYIHMLGIVYRDLKPENVLVRSDGHIMLTDFDLSLKCDASTAATPAQLISDNNHPLRGVGDGGAGELAPFAAASCILPSCIVPVVSCFQPKRRRRRKKPGHRGADLEFVAEPVELRSMSFVGTHEYLAPEIVSGEGHGSAVDWWTLGVFIFELLYGVTPFRGADHELTLANIVARALEFPKDPQISSAAKDLITGLLVKDPARRLGSEVGAGAIKRHPFFNVVNWALLRCMPPPYIPPAAKNAVDSREVCDDITSGAPVEYY